MKEKDMTATTTHSITLINMSDGSVAGHKAGCADIAKYVRKLFIDDPWTFEVSTKHEAWVNYNCDFLAEGEESGQYSIDWKACAKHVPQGHEDSFESYELNDLGKTAEEETTTTKESKKMTTTTSTPNVRTYDTASKALRIKALGVDCTIPYCRATPDESCKSAKGKDVEPHTRRVQRALAMEAAAAKAAAKAKADPKAASKAAAKPAKAKAAAKKGSTKAELDKLADTIERAQAPVTYDVCKPCTTSHHKQCKGTVDAPCGCSSKTHTA
jgi:hypothetical protein